MAGRAIFNGLEMLCPVSTSSAFAVAEQPELRAYKLGKQKCSYNQVELVVKDLGAGKVTELKVSEAIETCAGLEVDERLRESCLKFNVRFVNNIRMHLFIYVVYATPYGSNKSDQHSVGYHWIPVTRSKCRKGCKGPVIRGLQRFGRMPRRSATTLEGEDSWKEPRHLYIAIDEASTHVCPRHETSKFRLLVAVYDDKDHLLGTTVSSSIRVLANNDAPLGAASFKLHCHIKGVWGTALAAGESPSGISTYNAPFIGRSATIRSPRQDILGISSPPRSYKSTTTDETAKQVDIASSIGSFLNLQHDPSANEKIFCIEEGVGYAMVDKDHSLTDLCHRLFKVCVTKQERGQSTLTLRGLASALGARRRRILEILNALESIQIVSHLGKERFNWIGSGQISRALMKLKSNISSVPDPAESSRPSPSSARRGKLRTALLRQMEETRTDGNCPLRILSKRFIQLFLVHETGCSLRWEDILECIVDGQGHDPDTTRAKARRLGEIARIFSAIHLVRKEVDHKLNSGITYEWLGTQGVADYLVNINAAQESIIRKVSGRSVRTQQGRKSPLHNMKPKKRDRREIRGQVVCDHDSRLCRSTLTDVSRGQTSCQDLDNHCTSGQICLLPPLRTETPSRLSGKTSSPRAEIQPCHTSVPEGISQRERPSTARGPSEFATDSPRTTLDSDLEIFDSPCSSERTNQGFPAADRTDEGSTTTERLIDESKLISPEDRPWTSEQGSSGIISGFSTQHELDILRLDCCERRDLAQNSLPTGAEEAICELYNKAQVAPTDDHTSRASCDPAHQFPYKKRKFNITPFTAFAESNDCNHLSNPPSSSHEFARHKEDITSSFDPLFYLLCFYSPKTICELHAQNPAFLFTYVKESRALYHKWCAQNARHDQTLIRPVASVGKVSITNLNAALPDFLSNPGYYQSNGFLPAWPGH